MSECGCNHHQELASLRDQLAEYETFTKEIAKDLREKWCVPGRKEMWGFLRWLEAFCMTKFPDLYPHLNPPPADKGEFSCVGDPCGELPCQRHDDVGEFPAPGAESGREP